MGCVVFPTMKTTTTATTWGQLIRERRLSGVHLPDGSTRQVDFADMLQFSQATVSSWENGETTPSAKAQAVLISRLGITRDELWEITSRTAA